ncbi:MAG: hypothetical protein JWP63_218 [Candidatus Solibacter sp.]|nr:hypothetical protein [Candidatus Solibacter sp.]
MVDALSTTARLGKHQPFPGLSPFEISESAWFFGRARQTFDVLNRLREIRWIAVVGPSGCGKSSLIKAGVLATLQQGYLGGDWKIVSTRPADSPMSNLVAALQQQLPDVPGVDDELRSGALGLVGVARQAKLPPNGRLLVLIDQFEELFQFVRRADERSVSARRRGDASADELSAGARAQEEAKAFLKLLLTAALSDSVPVYIVITMRSEWLGYCAAYGGLAEAINEGLYLVPEMSRTELRKAIVQPILQAGGEIVSPLVDRMLNDLDGRTDQLPVLQHALKLMWRERVAGEPLGATNYDAVGGFAKCLSQHADTVYGHLSPDARRVAEAVFKAITEITPDNRKVRRQSTAGAILPVARVTLDAMRPALDAFSGEDTGFLVVSPTPATERSIVDISHEALIRQWDTLKCWVEEEAAGRRACEQLEHDAEVWKKIIVEKGGIHSDDYLYVGSHLQTAGLLRDRPDFQPSPATIEFLKASVDTQRRKARNRRLQIWGSVLAVVVTLAWSLVYIFEKRMQTAAAAAQSATVAAERDAQRAQFDARVKSQAAAEKERDRLATIVSNICKDQRGAASAVCGKLSSETSKPQGSTAPRVYFHITAESQRPQADACGKLLAAQGYAVQGIEKVSRFPDVASVRYFHQGESTTANSIAGALEGCQLRRVKAIWISGFDSAPAGQFEIWFTHLPDYKM